MELREEMNMNMKTDTDPGDRIYVQLYVEKVVGS